MYKKNGLNKKEKDLNGLIYINNKTGGEMVTPLTAVTGCTWNWSNCKGQLSDEQAMSRGEHPGINY